MTGVPVESLTDNDVSLIERFRDEARQFAAALATLKQPLPASAPSALLAERAALIARGDTIKAGVETATKAVDAVWSLIGSWFGLDGLQRVRGLGAVPLVPLAVIAGSLAAIAYFMNDYASYRARLNAWQATNPDAGALPPAPDSAIDRLGSNAAKLGILALVGFVAWAYFNRSN